MTLPFVALLVTPAPAGDAAAPSILWPPLVALIALLVTMAVAVVDDRFYVDRTPPGPAPNPP